MNERDDGDIIFNHKWDKLAMMKKYFDIWVLAALIGFHFIINSNRYYLVLLIVVLIVLNKSIRSILNSLWLVFLTIWPFSRGKYYDSIIIPKADWGGGWDLTLGARILFSDILLVLIVYYLLTRRSKFKNQLLIKKYDRSTLAFLLLLVVVVAVSTIQSSFVHTSSYYLLRFIKLVLVYLIAKVVMADRLIAKKSIQVLIMILCLSIGLVIGQFINKGPLGLAVEENQALYGWFANESRDMFRPGGLYIDPNLVATWLAVFLPVGLIKGLTSKSKQYWQWIGILLGTASLIVVGSRASWVISVLMGAGGVIYAKRHFKFYYPDLIINHGKKILIVILLIFSPMIVDRMRTINYIFGPKGGATYRLNQVKMSGQYLISQPWGVGIGIFPYGSSLDFYGKQNDLQPTLVHNVLAQVGAETGMLGLVFYLGFLWFLIKAKLTEFSKTKTVFGLSMLLALSSMVLLLMVFPWFLHPKIAELFWILAAFNYSYKVQWL